MLRSQTLAALILLLLAFVAGHRSGAARHGQRELGVEHGACSRRRSESWRRGQTLVMLTGGIDLSVASVATASAYIMATHSRVGRRRRGAVRPRGRPLRRPDPTGVGIALLRVQPLVMTLGTGLMTEGMAGRLQPEGDGEGPHVPQFIEDLAPGSCSAPSRTISSSGRRSPRHHLRIAAPPATAVCCMRSGTTREACHLAGIRVWRVLLVNYVLCSLSPPPPAS